MSGLIQVKDILHDIQGIGFVYFDEKDVVRHRLVQEIIKASDRHQPVQRRHYDTGGCGGLVSSAPIVQSSQVACGRALVAGRSTQQFTLMAAPFAYCLPVCRSTISKYCLSPPQLANLRSEIEPGIDLRQTRAMAEPRAPQEQINHGCPGFLPSGEGLMPEGVSCHPHAWGCCDFITDGQSLPAREAPDDRR